MPTEDHRATLARSLQLLIAATKMTAPQIADRAGVDPKTVNNMVNGRFGATIDKIEDVAKALKLQAWQLLMPGYIEAFLADDRHIERIVGAYLSTDDTGRNSILAVAEMAARGHVPEPPKPKRP